MSLKLLFWLTSVNCFCIVSILAIQTLPTTQECAKNFTQMCKFQHCKYIHTNNSKRSEFIELSSQNTTNLLLEFYVIGSHDCHVHLSPIANLTQANYEELYDFIIGGFNNSRTVVRHGQKLLRQIQTENVLSGSQPVQIRIEIVANGIIRIFRNNEQLPEIVDRSLRAFRYFRFATGQKDDMEFYYDCRPHQIRSSLATIWKTSSNGANRCSSKISVLVVIYLSWIVFIRR